MKYFRDTYKDALGLAKELAEKAGCTVNIKQENGCWYVEGPEVNGLQQKSSPSRLGRKNDYLRHTPTSSRPPSRPNGQRKKPRPASTNVRIRKPEPGYLKPASSNSVHVPKASRRSKSSGNVRDVDLCAIKIFYLGQGITKSSTRALAVELIKAELAILEANGVAESKILFFKLLLAEIFRETDEALKCRKEAKKLDKALGSGMFDAYMNVADATLSKSFADKFTGHGIVRGGIESHRVEFSQGQYGLASSWLVDNSLAALGLSESDLSRSQLDYLHRTNLKQIIESDLLIPQL